MVNKSLKNKTVQTLWLHDAISYKLYTYRILWKLTKIHLFILKQLGAFCTQQDYD